MTRPETIPDLPRLPLDQDSGPVFAAPWEAKVFAMTVKAHDAGLFTWPEWADALGAELAKDGDGTGRGAAAAIGYYDHWLGAFEKLLAAKGIAEAGQLTALRDAWDAAARATPHGQPIELAAQER